MHLVHHGGRGHANTGYTELYGGGDLVRVIETQDQVTADRIIEERGRENKRLDMGFRPYVLSGARRARKLSGNS